MNLRMECIKNFQNLETPFIQEKKPMNKEIIIDMPKPNKKI